MRKEDTEFKTIFFIWGYHLYVTIPIRSKSSFMFRVIECGKDCREIKIYLKNYLMFNKNKKNYLSLNFFHGWVVEMRIHSAKSLIQLEYNKQLSLKYDTKKIKGDLKSINI